jgi:hypothetical protein
MGEKKNEKSRLLILKEDSFKSTHFTTNEWLKELESDL